MKKGYFLFYSHWTEIFFTKFNRYFLFHFCYLHWMVIKLPWKTEENFFRPVKFFFLYWIRPDGWCQCTKHDGIFPDQDGACLKNWSCLTHSLSPEKNLFHCGNRLYQHSVAAWSLHPKRLILSTSLCSWSPSKPCWQQSIKWFWLLSTRPKPTEVSLLKLLPWPSACKSSEGSIPQCLSWSMARPNLKMSKKNVTAKMSISETLVHQP